MSEPNQPESKVLSLSTGERITVVKRESSQWCHSHCVRVLVDTKERRLTCLECGQAVEPFDWVHRMAREESHLLGRISRLKVELDEYAPRLEELKAEEKRVKARISAAKQSLLKSAGL